MDSVSFENLSKQEIEIFPIYEDNFSFLAQNPSLPDLSDHGYNSNDWRNEFSLEDWNTFDAINTPPMDSFSNPNLNLSIPGVDIHGNGGFGMWGEFPFTPLVEPEKKMGLEEELNQQEEKKIKNRKRREEKNINMLPMETISQYFYMPITEAAKKLNVGQTFLKKRCRELGIRRWPHRKLTSLQALIDNIQLAYDQEMGKEGDKNRSELGEVIKILEMQRRVIEENPDMEMEDKTKKLRQACFKINYKKRKFNYEHENMSKLKDLVQK